MHRMAAWTLVILWCLVIFFFSAEDRSASHQRSKEITEIVEQITVKVLDDKNIDIKLDKSVEHYVRKISHVLVYFILTFFLFYALALSKVRGYKLYFLTLLIVMIYAVLDELHQAYVPGRGPMIGDVFIDGIGVLSGLLVFSNMKKIFHIE